MSWDKHNSPTQSPRFLRAAGPANRLNGSLILKEIKLFLLIIGIFNIVLTTNVFAFGSEISYQPQAPLLFTGSNSPFEDYVQKEMKKLVKELTEKVKIPTFLYPRLNKPEEFGERDKRIKENREKEKSDSPELQERKKTDNQANPIDETDEAALIKEIENNKWPELLREWLATPPKKLSPNVISALEASIKKTLSVCPLSDLHWEYYFQSTTVLVTFAKKNNIPISQKFIEELLLYTEKNINSYVLDPLSMPKNYVLMLINAYLHQLALFFKLQRTVPLTAKALIEKIELASSVFQSITRENNSARRIFIGVIMTALNLEVWMYKIFPIEDNNYFMSHFIGVINSNFLLFDTRQRACITFAFSVIMNQRNLSDQQEQDIDGHDTPIMLIDRIINTLDTIEKLSSFVETLIEKLEQSKFENTQKLPDYFSGLLCSCFRDLTIKAEETDFPKWFECFLKIGSLQEKGPINRDSTVDFINTSMEYITAHAQSFGKERLIQIICALGAYMNKTKGHSVPFKSGSLDSLISHTYSLLPTMLPKELMKILVALAALLDYDFSIIVDPDFIHAVLAHITKTLTDNLNVTTDVAPADIIYALGKLVSYSKNETNTQLIKDVVIALIKHTQSVRSISIGNGNVAFHKFTSEEALKIIWGFGQMIEPYTESYIRGFIIIFLLDIIKTKSNEFSEEDLIAINNVLRRLGLLQAPVTTGSAPGGFVLPK